MMRFISRQAIRLLGLALLVNLTVLAQARADFTPMTSDEYAAWLTVTSEQLFGAGEHFNDDKWYLNATAASEGASYSGHTASGTPFVLTALEIDTVVTANDYHGYHVTHRFVTAEMATPLGTVLLDVLDTAYEHSLTGAVTDLLLPVGYAGTVVDNPVMGLTSGPTSIEPEPKPEERDPCADCISTYNARVLAAQDKLKKDLRDCALWLVGGFWGGVAGALCAGFAAGDAADDISAGVKVYCACMKAAHCPLPPAGPPCKD